MAYKESEYLQISGLQHFSFCRRQWALIHIEEQWAENERTVDGHLFHERAHDSSFREKRGDTLIVRGISCSSETLGVSGQCDVLEFHKDPEGVPLRGCEGKWVPYPVEYKKGAEKENDADRLQLCCQAMCLEEMLCVDIPEGALYYGETKRRERVVFSKELREKVKSLLQEMRQYYMQGYTPKVKPSKSCNACSVKELCLPRLLKVQKASAYVKQTLEEEG